MFVCWTVQMLLCSLLALEMTDLSSDSSLSMYPQDSMLVVARFIAGIVLHLNLQSELRQGLDVMKFANNHEYRFLNYRIAWLAGCMQFFMIITVEMVNFIAILNSTTILDVVMNFMALTIIAEFDN